MSNWIKAHLISISLIVIGSGILYAICKFPTASSMVGLLCLGAVLYYQIVGICFEVLQEKGDDSIE